MYPQSYGKGVVPGRAHDQGRGEFTGREAERQRPPRNECRCGQRQGDATEGAQWRLTEAARCVNKTTRDGVEGGGTRLIGRGEGGHGHRKHDLPGGAIDPRQEARDKPNDRQGKHRPRHRIPRLRRADRECRRQASSTRESEGKATGRRKRRRCSPDLDGVRHMLTLRAPKLDECHRAEREGKRCKGEHRDDDAKAGHHRDVGDGERAPPAERHWACVAPPSLICKGTNPHVAVPTRGASSANTTGPVLRRKHDAQQHNQEQRDCRRSMGRKAGGKVGK